MCKLKTGCIIISAVRHPLLNILLFQQFSERPILYGHPTAFWQTLLCRLSIQWKTSFKFLLTPDTKRCKQTNSNLTLFRAINQNNYIKKVEPNTPCCHCSPKTFNPMVYRLIFIPNRKRTVIEKLARGHSSLPTQKGSVENND